MYFPKNVHIDCRATQSPIQWIPRDLSLGIKWLGHGVDLSPPSSSIPHISQLESNASLFSCITSFFLECMFGSCPYYFCVSQVI